MSSWAKPAGRWALAAFAIIIVVAAARGIGGGIVATGEYATALGGMLQ